MLSDKYQRMYVALAVLIILAIGMLFGSYLISNLAPELLEAVKISLSFTSIIIALITVSLVIEIRKFVETQLKKR